MTTAATYCRISADRLELGAGVERQRVDTERLCADRGWIVTERLVDNDRSASRYASKAREGWTRLLELLDARAIDAVVAYDLDRLTRRPDELSHLIAAAERGVKIVTVTGSLLDLSTGDGIFAARILLAVAEKEAANASRRQKAKLRHDAENGRPHWVRRPFGFTLSGEVVEVEAEWIRTMVRWITEEGSSATEVAVRLNAAGVAQATGRQWQSAGVKLLLRSARNIGKREYLGNVIGDAMWPAVVDEPQWRAANAALAARSQGTRQGRRSMLTGLVYCSTCDLRMQRTNVGERAEYRCGKHADLGTGCGQSIRAHYVEQFATDLTLERLGAVVAQAPTTDPTDPDAEGLRADLAELAAMFGRGELTIAEFRSARGPLSARLEAAENTSARRDTSAALHRLAGDGATLDARWGDLDNDLKRRLVSLVVERFTISPALGRGRRGDPRDRIDLTLMLDKVGGAK